jgi:hypothetical protein
VWRHPYGLQVSIMDADTVSETNCVRQPFSTSDIGLNKATVLVNRINMFWGTKWLAEPAFFACSAESVGRFWFWQSSQGVIEGYLHRFEGSKSEGSSGNHSNFVVEALDSAV